jgi:hypothetical protein
MDLGSGNPVDIARADTSTGRFDLTLLFRLSQPESLLPGFLVILSTSAEYKL